MRRSLVLSESWGHTLASYWPLGAGSCLDVIGNNSFFSIWFFTMFKFNHILTWILHLPHRQQLIDSCLVWGCKLIDVLISPLYYDTICFYFSNNIKIHNRILSPDLNSCRRTQSLQHTYFHLCFISLLRPHGAVDGFSLRFSLEI